MGFDVHWLRDYCLAKPGVTEHIQWGDNLVLKVAGKVFAVTAFEPDDICLACKVTQEEFSEWTEREGVIQAPYFAKRQWIGVEKRHSLAKADVKRLVDRSYELVVAGMTKKAQAALAGGAGAAAVRGVEKAKSNATPMTKPRAKPNAKKPR